MKKKNIKTYYNYVKLLIISSLLITAPLFNYANQKTDSHIFGHVICCGEHIVGAHVNIKGTQIATATDRTGHYFLYNLPVGEYTIVASAIGYTKQEKKVTIVEGKTIEIDFELERDVVAVEEVVITGSRIEQNRKDAPVIVGIINSKQLKNTNSLNLSDAVSFQTGLRVENNCQNCGFNQVRMNGLEGTYSQILIDGRPTFSSLTGVYGLEQIPVSMIDRVEIVKGAGSATYGSNAIGGTINVITKEPIFNSYQIQHNISAIDDKTFDNSSSFNSTLLNNGNSGGITIFGNVRNRKSYDHDDDGFTEIPKLNMGGLGFKAFQRINNKSKITAEYYNINDFRRGGNYLHTIPHNTDITEQVSHLINSASFTFDRLLDDNKGRLSVFSSFRATDRETYYGTDGDPNAYGNSNDRVSYSGFEFLRYFDKKLLPNSLLFGADYSYNSLTDRQLGYNRTIEQTTENTAIFAQGQWKKGWITTLIGFRADKHNLVDNIIVSPRLNFLISHNEFFQTRLGFATGFRAPQTFDEDLHIMAVGGEVHIIEIDDDLMPETSLSYTASFDWNPKFGNKKLNILTEAFFTKLDNVFILEAKEINNDNNLIMQRTNGEGAQVMGVNLELRYTANENLNFQIGFTSQRSNYLEEVEWSEDENVETTKKMLRTPDNYGFTTLNYTYKKDLTFSLSGIFTGKMLVSHYAGYIENDVLKTTNSFYDINFMIAKVFKLKNKNKFEITGGMKNLLNNYQNDFDKGSKRDSGYMYGPIYPRHIFIGIRFGNIL